MSSLLYAHESFAFGDKTVHLGFTGVKAGNLGLHVDYPLAQTLQNRVQLEKELGSGAFVYLHQVHGKEVFDADAHQLESATAFTQAEGQRIRSQAPQVDAAVSSAGVPLAIMVADCIPVLLLGQSSAGNLITAVAHAGRKGLLDGVLQETVKEMRARGAKQIRVWLGPSICGRCYEVPEQMRGESTEVIAEVYSTTSWGTPALDLPAGAVAVLEKIPEVVEINRELATCTLENEELYSHRRGTPLGRFAGLIWTS